MSKSKKRITAQQAGKILGTTSEAVRQLAKAGLISSIVMDSGKKKTRYYYEDEILERKAACKEYMTLAKDTEEILARAKEENKQARELENAISLHIRADKHSTSKLSFLCELFDTAVRCENGYEELSTREQQIIHRMIMLEHWEDISNSYDISAERLRQITVKAVRNLKKHISTKQKEDELTTEIELLRDEKKELEKKVEYLKVFIKNNIAPKEQAVNKITDTYYISKLTPEQIDIKNKLKKKISTSPLITVRTYNCLRAAEINTYEDLCQLNVQDILKFRNFGRKSMRNLYDVLEKEGLMLGMDITEYGLIPRHK